MPELNYPPGGKMQFFPLSLIVYRYENLICALLFHIKTLSYLNASFEVKLFGGTNRID